MPARPKRKISAKIKPAALKSKKAPVTARKKPGAASNKNSKTKIKVAADTASRLVIHENGMIISASGSLFPAGLQDQPARDAFDFVFPEEAMHDRPMMGNDGKDAWTSAIVSGDHDVNLFVPGGQSQKISMRFDRIDMPDGRKFLVASTIDKKSKTPPDLTSLISKIAPAPQAKVVVPAKNTESLDQSFSTFINMTHDLMLLMDKEGNILQSNDTFRDVLGYDAEDLKTITFVDLIHPDDRSHIRPTFKSMMQDDMAKDGRLIAFECRVLSKSGEPHWLEWRQKRQGEMIYAVCRDLTDSKSHEEALIRHQQQLSEAQAMGHMGHWRWKLGEDHIVFSDEIYRIFDVNPDYFTPTIKSVNSLLHRRDIGRMAQGFQRAMIERKNYEMEFRVIRPDGKARFITLQGRCEMDAEGDVGALFGIMQDVTERIQNERELRDAKEAAERAYAAKSQFLANMSHELRTPLNAIIGFSEMIQRQLLGPIGTEKYLDYIGNIRDSGEHLLDLITDILDMSKIEAGKYELDLEEFNLLKVLRLSCHMIEGRALDAQVKIICDMREDDFVDIVADRRAVMQIMLNLLSNSVKFTEPNGEVKAEFVVSENDISIKVTDTGIGIPASKLRYVTEPFEQAANHFTRNHEGSGLGLAITKELVELHGGSLQIESTVGVGTAVTFRLPKDCSAYRRDGKTSEILNKSNILTARFGS